MFCWFSISYALWAELLSILEHEHIWHANRADLHTTKPLLFFQLIWLLLLQYLKFPFHCWEETGFSISRSFFSSSFPCPIIDAVLGTGSSAGTQSGGSQKVTLGHGQLHPTPSPWEPTHLATFRQRHVCHLDENRGYPHQVGANPELLLNTASAECVRAVSDMLISENCFLSNILLFYPHGDLLMLKIAFGRWSLPCCW